MKVRIVLFLFPLLLSAQNFQLPEIYQDVFIHGEVVQRGVRSCEDRYEAIRAVLNMLPKHFKSLDIGASQGYFSFRMSQEYQARCTLIEDSYTTSSQIWQTGDYLKYLCEINAYPDLALLQQKVYAEDLRKLAFMEQFDLVLAFSVIHHMKKSDEESYEVYRDFIDSLFLLAPVVLIENPINTGPHTQYIRSVLQEKRGRVIYQSSRGTLLYEIYLFDNRLGRTFSYLPNLSLRVYQRFCGSYSSLKEMP